MREKSLKNCFQKVDLTKKLHCDIIPRSICDYRKDVSLLRHQTYLDLLQDAQWQEQQSPDSIADFHHLQHDIIASAYLGFVPNWSEWDLWERETDLMHTSRWGKKTDASHSRNNMVNKKKLILSTRLLMTITTHVWGVLSKLLCARKKKILAWLV